MLEIRKTVIAFDEKELLGLERIIVDSDEKEAFRFLRKIVYEKLSKAQRHCEVYYARNQKDSDCLR